MNPPVPNCEAIDSDSIKGISKVNKRYAVEEVLYRADGRCGSSFPLPNGSPSQCNPKSDDPCCSKYGYCGRDSGHCQCEKCIDYRQGKNICYDSPLSSCTLVVRQTLLDFRNFPTCTPLFQPALLFNFKICKKKHSL